MSNVINYYIKIILSANEMWIWRYNEKHSSETHKLHFLEWGKRTLSIRKDWGKWVVINVNKSSCFLVIWWKEILWKLIFCLKSKLLCFILLSAVHFTTQGSTRIDCDLSFYFWIGTTQNKIPVRQLSFTSRQQQWIRPHARSELVRAPPPKNCHCHFYLVAHYAEKEVAVSARNAQSIKKFANKEVSISFILELSLLDSSFP